MISQALDYEVSWGSLVSSWEIIQIIYIYWAAEFWNADMAHGRASSSYLIVFNI